MDKRAQIMAAAQKVFQEKGFQGVGVDRLLECSGASTRTLYKHFGSRDCLAAAVLADRARRFLAVLSEKPVPAQYPVASLFDDLRRWMAAGVGVVAAAKDAAAALASASMGCSRG